MAPVLTRTFRITHRVRATPERVFRAWLDVRLARRWLFATARRPLVHVAIDPRVGGSFRCTDDRGIEHAGRYREIIPPTRLAFTLSLEGNPHAVTRVTVEIAGSRHGSALALVHDGVPRDRASAIADRWRGLLYGLDETLASTPAVRRRIPRFIAQHPTPACRSAA